MLHGTLLQVAVGYGLSFGYLNTEPHRIFGAQGINTHVFF